MAHDEASQKTFAQCDGCGPCEVRFYARQWADGTEGVQIHVDHAKGCTMRDVSLKPHDIALMAFVLDHEAKKQGAVV